MTYSAYDDYVAYTKQHFQEGLIRAGFTEDGVKWRGPICRADGTTEVLITLPSRFPFRAPHVAPAEPDAVPWSWHRELDGALCLVAEDDHEDLWWTEAPAFLEHITAWFEQADSGWPDDRPDLDLDRYFEPSTDTRLYLYGDLGAHCNGSIRFRPAGHSTMRMSSGTKPTKSSRRSKVRFGYVADLGDVDVPPRTWEDISAGITASANLDRRIRNRAIQVVVLVYRRGIHDGAVVIEVSPTASGDIRVRRLSSAADTDAARNARAGVLAPQLRECRVAVVGLGALGSFTADMLVRSGIRHLTLVDGDVVMPGNLVRHLVGPEAIGLSKVKAVKQHLAARGDIVSANIHVIEGAVESSEVAVELFAKHDLVVDTAADFSTTALLHVSARAMSKRVISAAIQNDGTSYRIDLLPPLGGADPLPRSTIQHHTPQLFEAGCGSPISPTPPYVVIEAAATAARHIIGLLADQPVDAAGEVRHLSTAADEKNQ